MAASASDGDIIEAGQYASSICAAKMDAHEYLWSRKLELIFQNPAMKYVELASRGYMLLDITRERIQAEWWYVDNIETRNDQQRFAAAYFSEDGDNRVQAGTSASQERTDAPALAPVQANFNTDTA